ncbi:MAG TPA: GTP-dependent dephospho-CoA kinase family protein, partial [Candidatus Thermoplasmatota archaeon]|nr:GTP-dependent dephospho-CoA kinase family protein [Candidatus Thermoplasmatota archaeon]
RELAAPFGPVLGTDGLRGALADGDALVAVGDVVSLTLKQLGLTPRLFVCDYQTQRGQPDPLFEAELGGWGRIAFRVRNPAGHVTREAWDAIRLGLEAGPADPPVRIVVEGEEDLLGLPCFLEAPAGAKVLYGMPGQGVAVVAVDAPLQERVRALLGRFTEVPTGASRASF